MDKIKDFPIIILRILIVLVVIAVITQVIAPRTSLYFRYRIYYPKLGNYLNDYDVVLISGEEHKIRLRNINQRARFSSTDFKVADTNYSGCVTAKHPGTAYIKVKLAKKTLICRIRVIELNHKELNLKQGDTKRLNVHGNWLFESYQSSDENIVDVSSFGKLTARSKGSAVITVKAKGRTMKCKVTVS